MPAVDGEARIKELEQENWQLRQQLKQSEEARSQSESLATERASELNQITNRLTQETHERKQSDHALAMSEARFQTIAATMPGAIFQFSAKDGNWRMNYISDRVYPIIGVTAAEVMQDINNFTERIHPDDLNQHRISIEASITNLEPWHFEGRVIKPDGEVRWWQGDSTPAYDEAGEIIFCGVLLDITDRKQAEEELRHSQQKLSLLFQQTPLAIIEWNIDREIQEWNPAAERIFGYRRDEVMGRPFGFLVPTALQQEVAQILDELDENQQFQQTVNENLTKDGRTIICEWYNVPLVTSDRQVVGSASLALDVTDRIQAESKLREQEEFLRNIFDGVQQDIFMLNVTETGDLRYGGWNWYSEKMIGITSADALGKTPEDIFGIELGTQVRQQFGECVKTQSKVTYEEHLTIDDQSIWLLTTLNPQFNHVGRLHKIVGTAIDITDLKQTEFLLHQKNQDLEQTLSELQNAQTQLIQSEKMSSLGQLVAGIAHEINNPVNFIHGNLTHANNYSQDLLQLVELYQTQIPDPPSIIKSEIDAIDLEFLKEDLPKVLESMKIGSERIREIVLSLRTFSRLDEAEFKAVDIHAGIDSTLMILQSRLKAKSDSPGIEILKDYGTLPPVDCYPGQLNQVFMNILSNAIDALEENPQSSLITISTHVLPSNWVSICISDNGAGMSEQVRSRLFDPFFTTKTVGKGTGLGLSISYQIITEKHKGRLLCESAPGKGAKFIIEIPIHQTSVKT
jgi:PAS domain S-box-containing protein